MSDISPDRIMALSCRIKYPKSRTNCSLLSYLEFILPISDTDNSNKWKLLLLLLLLKKKRRMAAQRAAREWYIRPLNLPRTEYGEFAQLIQRMRRLDDEAHFRYFRMDRERYDFLLKRVEPFLRHGQNYRFPISPDERLALTLRILASGNSQTSEADSFYIGKATVNNILHETCRAICSALSSEFLAEPTVADWAQIALDFHNNWNFPNCVGAIDGKHVIIKAPKNSGSLFYNYKESFSVVLLAVVDANYVFRVVDIGGYGRQSDGGTFSGSVFGRKLNAGQLPLPPPRSLPETDITCPHVFVADKAFPLKENIMRPFPGKGLWGNHWKRVFNYRLSRARRIVENAFGILAARWRIFGGPIRCSPGNVDYIVKSCVCLHNMLRILDGSTPNFSRRYVPPSFVDNEEAVGEWRGLTDSDSGMRNIRKLAGNRNGETGLRIRDLLASYFVSVKGYFPWQSNIVYGAASGLRDEEDE